MTHDEVRDLVPIYALDGLSGNEELEVRAHLTTCAACRGSLESCQEATAAFAVAVDPVAPPPALRRRVLDGVAQTAQLPATRRQPAGPSHHSGNAQRLPWRWQRMGALVAVAAVLVLGVLSITLGVELHSRNAELNKEQHFIASYVGAPVLTTVPMVAAGSQAKAAGQVYVGATGESGGLVATGLSNPRGNVYQLWLIQNGKPSPLAAFTPDSAGVALVPIQANLSGMQGMAVTLEAHAGNKTPQGPKVLQSA